jgi:hypothetical protein
MNRTSLKLSPERKEKLRVARKIFQENTDSKTIDKALDIVKNLKENAEMIAPRVLVSITGAHDMGKFLIKDIGGNVDGRRN